jgi:hypothetical protein
MLKSRGEGLGRKYSGSREFGMAFQRSGVSPSRRQEKQKTTATGYVGGGFYQGSKGITCADR